MRLYTAHFPSAFKFDISSEPSTDISLNQMMSSAVLVREGFSWGAFLFSIVWAIRYGLWFSSLAMIVILGLLLVLSEFFDLSWNIRGILLFGYALVCGYSANDWKRLCLRYRGWYFITVVAAKNEEQALFRLAKLVEKYRNNNVLGSGDVEDQKKQQPLIRSSNNEPSRGFWT